MSDDLIERAFADEKLLQNIGDTVTNRAKNDKKIPLDCVCGSIVFSTAMSATKIGRAFYVMASEATRIPSPPRQMTIPMSCVQWYRTFKNRKDNMTTVGIEHASSNSADNKLVYPNPLTTK